MTKEHQPQESPSAPQSSTSFTILPDTISNYARHLLSHPPSTDTKEIETTISRLNLSQHIEGGYFVETDRDKLLVPNPFQHLPALSNPTATDDSPTRHASTTIFYLLTPRSPVGHFHRNRGRTVHTLHRGRGVYVLLDTNRRDSVTGKVPIETFVVGHDLEKGEKLQWIVEGGVFKASFLIPDQNSPAAGGTEGAGTTAGDEEKNEAEAESSAGGLLITETVVPGFEYADHDFLTFDTMQELLVPEQIEELKWLLARREKR
ncbi:hypothetical protein HRR83_000121 [Exophiala dermatitidis]|uniref:DUF985 domain-containing protein n=2 Tax=Exophiala dermatitidis TaxID=5970 RepID=H6C8D4_EXODN|nr:uncharacterized protein HMPREF1120_08326 [Exophiala dermatitidis NIH/UT8656]KAJ4523474.1 hypothetical protein HRR73_002656 [Exophiala dermatitidis]EHY60361.1 hypothetical protein HMPREF1120_08326 [Exophiala dermatitidis NIH/UT8656]KAJ4527369.1 hypothetical protein HRR74_000122 [Exophiala dermatitidis]KAJ4530929.1 hypothetical protein HRR76_008618 [Exophiala dermatitidis]KAJ4558101.1 hypothetical protein HRR77_000123 [Exophiala dermatitidis]